MRSLSFCFLFTTLYSSLLIFPSLAASNHHIEIHSIFPNFTASNFQSIDNGGAFLSSINDTFSASFVTPSPRAPRIYFSVVHVATQTVIWSANRNNPVSNTSNLMLTVDGLTMTDESNIPIWSTPVLSSPVSALQLLETGNLVLIDAKNVSLWQSFDYPTDTIVMRQRFPVGKSLVSATEDTDFSAGNYSLILSGEDLESRWFGQTYWKLSMDTDSFKESNKAVSSMEITSNGLYLYGDDDSVVWKLPLDISDFRIARIEPDGRFMIHSLDSDSQNFAQEFVRPSDFCLIPYICGELGLCSLNEQGVSRCTCPEGFQNDPSGCLPKENSLALSSGCNASVGSKGLESASSIPKYMNLSIGTAYFANNFMNPATRGVDLSVCQDLCSRNCSCLGIFYLTSSSSCYLVENNFGSIYNDTKKLDVLYGYVKVFEMSSSTRTNADRKRHFPIVGIVLIPLLGFAMIMIMVALAIVWQHKKRSAKKLAASSLSRWGSSSSSVLGTTSMLRLPSRFKYEELVEATDNFKTQVGSGGFGIVYKGTMRDETVVAIKKITNFGVRGKKEFFAELEIIGSIHHLNLVRLKGYCIHGSNHFLVYEFMNRGSLERILFSDIDPVLEWEDRFKIVLGTARALAYLHNDCQQKIIHCDIKPENILLNGSLQVKVSDFGLSKLLDHKTSKLLTTMRGTRGYLAPEWLTSSGITDKTDVYSFGMVLFEIVSGKRNCSVVPQNSSTGPSIVSSSSLEEMIYFPSLALEKHKQRRYSELVDPRLEGQVSEEEIEKIVRIALCCVHIIPTLRPTMHNVVEMLEGRLPLREPIVEALNFLQSFGGRQS